MYGKIYESTFSGSMVGSGSVVFSIWAYVIAHTKPDSMVELNPSLLSAVLGETEERIREGIQHLCSPDPRSRSKAHEGRRLLPKSEFLFFVPRYKHYHGLRNDEERRQYFREKKREQRERLRMCQTGMSNSVQVGQKCPTMSTQSESDTESSKGKYPLSIPSLSVHGIIIGKGNRERGTVQEEEICDFCETIGLPRSDGTAMFLHWGEKGTAKVKDWKLTIRKWKSFCYLPSQKQKSFKPSRPPDPREEKNEREMRESQERLREFYAKKGINL